MSDFTKILTRKNSLRKNCADLSVEALEKVLSDLSELLVEKQEEQARLLAVEEEKNAKIAEILSMMAEGAIDVSDLSGLSEYAVKKKVEPKYRLTTSEGEVVEWSGRGRTPAAFKAKLDEGFSKEDFLI